MKVAIFGRSISFAILDELIDFVESIKDIQCEIAVPQAILISEELIELTPFVSNYQSAKIAPVIWASALRQFFRM
ncbi:hypothetical protein HOT32_gp09 [Erwinia phage Faunus]|uniref:Uncharacterized protein n=1 Tax=Erwinia phage Faunus TaxID=2182346 RepID=A0A2U8UWG2_9CAUD|nr:hypothetical protein HOT32_gp09 [Erwinia phage Faunus]AWN08592.1 hypothetical protein [Erwinia phage Faunus]